MKPTLRPGLVAGLLTMALAVATGAIAKDDHVKLDDLKQVLVSPPNDFDWASDKAKVDDVVLVCAAVNAGSKQIPVRVEAKDIDGNTLNSDTKDVPPGATIAIDATSSGGSVAPRYCKFSTTDAKSLRASACVFEQDLGCTATVAAW
jgi:hypothetical protein